MQSHWDITQKLNGNKLFQAIRINNLDKIRQLLQEDPEIINYTDHEGNTPLHWAIIKDDLKLLKILLDVSEINLFAENKYHQPPEKISIGRFNRDIACVLKGDFSLTILEKGRTLIRAIQNNDLSISLALIREYPEIIHYKDHNGNTPLHCAIQENNIDILEALLNNPAINYNVKNEQGHTPKKIATLQKKYSDIAYVFGGNLKVSLLPEGRELIKAIRSNDSSKSLQLLNQYPELIHYKDGKGNSPLHWVAREGNVDILEALLNNPGINRNLKNQEKHTPCMVSKATTHNDISYVIRGDFTLSILREGRKLAQALKNKDLSKTRQLLREHPEVVHYKDNNGNTPLHWAVEQNNIGLLEELLKIPGINPNSRNLWNKMPEEMVKESSPRRDITYVIRGNFTPTILREGRKLVQMIEKNNLQDSLLLLDQHPEVIHYKDANGDSPLHWAARKGHLKLIEHLLTIPGISSNAKNWWGNTAESISNLIGRRDIASFFAENFTMPPLAKWNELIQSIQNNDFNKSLLLLTQYPELIHYQDANGDSPLHWAAREGNVDIMEALLKLPGINRYSENQLGQTPSAVSESTPHSDIAYVIRGEFTPATLRAGRTLSKLLEKNDIRRILPLLSEHPEVIHYKDANGNTPLHWAVKQNKIGLLERLLKIPGIDRNVKNCSNQTPEEIVEEFSIHGDISYVLRGDFSPAVLREGRRLIQAIREKDLSTSLDLLHRNPEIIHYKDANGDTPLHWAAKTDNIDLVEALLNISGISRSAQNREKNTPAMLATSFGYRDIAYAIWGDFSPALLKKGRQLMEAIQYGDLDEIIELLNQYPEVVHYKDIYGDDPLHRAAQENNESLLEVLLMTSGVNRNTLNQKGNTALKEALRRGHTDLAAQLQCFTPAKSNKLHQFTNSQELKNMGCDHIPFSIRDCIQLDIFHEPVTLPSGITVERRNLKVINPQDSSNIICPLTKIKYNRDKVLKSGTNWMLKELAASYVEYARKNKKTEYFQQACYEEKDELLLLVHLAVTNPKLTADAFKDANQIMKDPVTLSSGHTVDRSTIDLLATTSLEGKKIFKCPRTQQILNVEEEKARRTNPIWKNLIAAFSDYEKRIALEHSKLQKSKENTITSVNNNNTHSSTHNHGIFDKKHPSGQIGSNPSDKNNNIVFRH